MKNLEIICNELLVCFYGTLMFFSKVLCNLVDKSFFIGLSGHMFKFWLEHKFYLIFYFNTCNTCYYMIIEFVMCAITNVMCWLVGRDVGLELNECGSDPRKKSLKENFGFLFIFLLEGKKVFPVY